VPLWFETGGSSKTPRRRKAGYRDFGRRLVGARRQDQRPIIAASGFARRPDWRSDRGSGFGVSASFHVASLAPAAALRLSSICSPPLTPDGFPADVAGEAAGVGRRMVGAEVMENRWRGFRDRTEG